MKQFLFALVALGILAGMTSCRQLNPSIMLHSRHFKCKQCDTLNLDSLKRLSDAQKEYHITPNDIIEFRLFSNDGFKMIDLITMNSRENPNIIQANFQYVIDVTGHARLPMLDTVKLAGLTIRAAEDTLEKRYSKFYYDPFVVLHVINKRVLVFPGQPGAARVVPLNDNNTTLMEALATAGGLSHDGKAWEIKLIRQVGKETKAYHIDLSTIDGIDQGNIVLQSNDIIYVEPRRYWSRELLSEITPLLSLISSAILLAAYFTRR
jgi:polysaccharide export outer membrane protein